ncbi:hypothetical protein E5350_08295 [Lactobacillus johnsonii]|uniref:Uncharacterized protein n=1 Tax=Lactobacillus johnsonii TaxID=33959 RepID=A0AAW5LU00_LACJH|nr:hypothetical protein [Lactobacillus johnsonii]MCR1915427.1 hypothetical protein [Lactobacillus johnsonii]TGY26110.1 hypothetical protein E5350_08295 [Lactobacillus johnsonii]
MDLKDYKRVFQICSFILILINITKIEDRNSIELSVIMFLVSNLITVQGLHLKERYLKNKIKYIRKAFEYIIWIFAFILFVDESQQLTVYINNQIFRIIMYSGVIIGFAYCLCLTFLTLSEKGTEDLIKREIEKASVNFDDAIQEVVKYVNENGGWSNFIKTPIGQQFAASVKMKSKDIHPRDFKKSHKRRKYR